MAIARELGWKEGTAVEPQPEASTSKSSKQDGEGDDDDIWDDDTESSKRSSGGRGLGVKVSTMTMEEDEQTREAGSLHALVLEGDVSGVETYLQDHPDADLNQFDEHVCIFTNNHFLRSVKMKTRDIRHYT